MIIKNQKQATNIIQHPTKHIRPSKKSGNSDEYTTLFSWWHMKYSIIKEDNNLKRLSLCMMENLTMSQNSFEQALKQSVPKSICVGSFWMALTHCVFG